MGARSANSREPSQDPGCQQYRGQDDRPEQPPQVGTSRTADLGPDLAALSWIAPPPIAMRRRNHCSRKSSTDFCNKICQKRSFRLGPNQLDTALNQDVLNSPPDGRPGNAVVSSPPSRMTNAPLTTTCIIPTLVWFGRPYAVLHRCRVEDHDVRVHPAWRRPFFFSCGRSPPEAFACKYAVFATASDS
jgi:hypothetical protein